MSTSIVPKSKHATHRPFLPELGVVVLAVLLVFLLLPLVGGGGGGLLARPETSYI